MYFAGVSIASGFAADDVSISENGAAYLLRASA
jgi:hypothetical protein